MADEVIVTETIVEPVVEPVTEPVVEPVKEPAADDGKVPREELLKERRKRQDTEKRLREYEQKQIDAETLQEKETLKQQFMEDGFLEPAAERMAAREVKLSTEIRQMKAGLSSPPIDTELKELAESDEFYADALDHRNAIAEKMKAFKCDAETAYNLVRGKERRRDLQTTMEQRLLQKRDDVKGKQVPSSSPSKPVNPYPLDENDKKALKNLQNADPSGKWTEAKYWQIKQR